MGRKDFFKGQNLRASASRGVAKPKPIVFTAVKASGVNVEEVISQAPSAVSNSKTVAAVILGGGAGTRLYPLTKQRAKPAVPIGGAYRLIDVPMSNCLNSGISKMYILTQFNSVSLNRHLARTYNFGNGIMYGGNGFVEVLAATQTPGLGGKEWFQGTADAVRQVRGAVSRISARRFPPATDTFRVTIAVLVVVRRHEEQRQYRASCSATEW